MLTCPIMGLWVDVFTTSCNPVVTLFSEVTFVHFLFDLLTKPSLLYFFVVTRFRLVSLPRFVYFSLRYHCMLPCSSGVCDCLHAHTLTVINDMLLAINSWSESNSVFGRPYSLLVCCRCFTFARVDVCHMIP